MKLQDQFDIYKLYLIYRVFIAVLITAIYWSFDEHLFFGKYNQELFSTVLFSYLILTVSSLILGYLRQKTYQYESFINVVIDSIAISLLIHSSGGLSSGLGVLLAISIAFNSINNTRVVSLLFASIASLSILSISILNFYSGNLSSTSLTQSGILGLAYFAIALLSHQLVNRLKESEKVAKKMGDDLVNLASLNEHIIQKMQTGIIVISHQNIISLMNESAWLILGMPDGTRNTPLKEASATLEKQLDRWKKDNQFQTKLFKAENGSHLIRSSFTTLANAGNHCTLIFIEDASYIKEQAQQMKLASLGQLTASIAHEIRNPLGAISHASQLLDESEKMVNEDQHLTQIILNNTKRLNQVIENILTLSHRKASITKPIIIANLINKFIPQLIINHQLQSDQIRIKISPEQTTVYADSQQLEQVITTFFDNAVTHFNKDIKMLKLQIHAGIDTSMSGPYLDFIDNGESIPENIKDRIFEPFFTTRNAGTGLGLYVTSEICEANQIQIQYFPINTGGNCFRLIFPYTSTRKPLS